MPRVYKELKPEFGGQAQRSSRQRVYGNPVRREGAAHRVGVVVLVEDVVERERDPAPALVLRDLQIERGEGRDAGPERVGLVVVEHLAAHRSEKSGKLR